MYYLTTEDGWEKHDKKKTKEKLVLNRFSNADLSHKKIIIDLPAIAEGENTTFWTFIGQKGNEKYLLSKSVDVEKNELKCNVLVVNEQGKTLKSFAIDINMEDRFLRPGFTMLLPNKGHTVVAKLDSDIVTKRSGPVGSTEPRVMESRPVTTMGAFGNLMFDAESNAFYAYGLFGPKPFRTLGPIYEGFYVHKYDLDGKAIWKLNQAGSQELLDEKVFRVHGTPGDRNISLRSLNQHLNFSIQFRKSLYTYEISSEGKLISTKHKGDFIAPVDNFVYNSTAGSKSEAFVKTKGNVNDKHVVYTNFFNSEGEVLLEWDMKSSFFTLMLFK